MVAFQTADNEISNNDDVPGMVCTPGRKSSTNVIHSDCTDTIVPAQLTFLEQNALLRYAASNKFFRVQDIILSLQLILIKWTSLMQMNSFHLISSSGSAL